MEGKDESDKASEGKHRESCFQERLRNWFSNTVWRGACCRYEALRRYGAFRSSALVILVFCGTSLLFCLALLGRDIVRADIDSVPQLEESSRIYDRNGTLIYELYEKKRTIVPLSRISKEAQAAIIATEDRHFYGHSGFDAVAIFRAALANFKSATIKQGGSTITQQLARNIFLTPERSYWRKLLELGIALKIEHSYTKDQILEFYANRVYFGSGFYGIEAAAQGYFGKPAGELRLGEAALLAGVIKAPAAYSPHKNSSRALERRDQVLDAMVECRFVSPEQATLARQQPVEVRPRVDDLKNANYAIEYVKEQVLEMFGQERTFNGGLRVYATIDSRIQAEAEALIEDHLTGVEKGRAFARLSRASYLNDLRMQPAGEHAEDARPYYLQGALVSMDARTGEIYALVGGRSFGESKFNRAVYGRRQPGSAFKPFVYAAALESGMTPATLVEASPVEFMTEEGIYRPGNADAGQYGTVTLRTALRKSINTAAIHVGQEIGLDNIIRSAHNFGIEGKLPAVISLPLGAGEVTLLEMVGAYSAFPNEGRATKPRILLRVEDGNGQVLYSGQSTSRQGTDPQTAFLMTTMLADVVDRGTGSGVRAAGFRGPAAGKTGTTNDFYDAWFFGFTPDVVTGVWIGFDAPREIMRRGYGSSLAVPVWANFMKRCFPKSSKKEFTMPPGIVRVDLCAESGRLATPFCSLQAPLQTMTPDGELRDLPHTYLEYFRKDSKPGPCEMHLSDGSRRIAEANGANGESLNLRATTSDQAERKTKLSGNLASTLPKH